MRKIQHEFLDNQDADARSVRDASAIAIMILLGFDDVTRKSMVWFDDLNWTMYHQGFCFC